MEGDARRAVGTAQLVVISMYLTALVALPLIGRFAKTHISVGAGALAAVTAALLVAGIAEYGMSLWLEGKLLARARSGAARRGQHVVAAAVVVAALGESLAIYGLVLTLLGVPAWGAALYLLCAAHAFHLFLRWPRYVSAAEGAPY